MKHLATMLLCGVQRQSKPLIPVALPCPQLCKSNHPSNQTLNQIRKVMWLNTSGTCQWWDWVVIRSSEIATKWFVVSDHRLTLNSSCFVLTFLTCHAYVYQNENLKFLKVSSVLKHKVYTIYLSCYIFWRSYSIIHILEDFGYCNTVVKSKTRWQPSFSVLIIHSNQSIDEPNHCFGSAK